ncbi:hypothetical protein IKQ19_07920 [Candidatus Saccharibacteria bacterium]|nr:hypothetical protein [Candidatus Saccharibacteria bacterium]
MNKYVYLLIVLILVLLSSCTTEPEEVEPWDAAKVCPETGTNAYGMPNRGTFTDERDGEVYRYTTIGKQVWMAENLRYNAPYSMCCNDTAFLKQYCELVEHDCKTESCCQNSMCNLFGRYYSIIKNGDRFGPIDDALVDTICPKGWHIPTKVEWQELESNMINSGESEVLIASRMKSDDTIYFAFSKKYSHKDAKMESGSDDCAFNILPSGSMVNDGSFYNTGAYVLSKTQKNTNSLEVFHVTNYFDFFFQGYRDPIRCVMD